MATIKRHRDIHGVWNSQADADIRKRTLASAALFAGLAAGIFIVSRPLTQSSKQSKTQRHSAFRPHAEE